MIGKIHRGLTKWEQILMYIGSICIVIVMAMTTVDVVLRNIINHSILGVTELSALMLMPIFTCALPYVQARQNHIIIEFATEKAPPKLKAFLNMFGCVVGAFIFCSIAQKAVTEAVKALTRGDATMGAVSFVIWPAKMILAVVIVTLILRLVVDILRNIREMCGGQSISEENTAVAKEGK